ncbi:MAG TPA: hypothetical protein VG734_06865 [Lacunisphaera sp.]|nr:hypothetical protein [Lacunisphaera sp.]
MDTPSRLTCLLACGLLLAPALPAQEIFTLRTGFDYSTGNYGLPVSTEIITVPVSVAYAVTPSTTLECSVPYLRTNGPGDVIPGIGRYVRRLLQSKHVSQGAGDFTVGLTHDFAAGEDSLLAWSGGAEVKFGTASAQKSLGTGEDDFMVHWDVAWSGGAISPFATLGYRWLGNPAGGDLRNYLFGTVGVNWAWTEHSTVALLADWAQRNSDSGRASSNLTLAVTRALGEKCDLQVYGMIGHSDSTADHGYGLSIGRRF